MRREQRRDLWLNRLETAAFWACLVGGIAAIWLFVSATP
jgi:hypothetical protein